MRPMALVGLVMSMALLIAGCGWGSDSAPTPKEPERVTTTAEVAEMKARFEENQELRPRYKEEREYCEATTSEDEIGKRCVEPLQEKLAKLAVNDEVLANELMLNAGQGCRDALREASVFEPIDEKTIAACKRDIGKKSGEGSGG
jgi:hypothetical protein